MTHPAARRLTDLARTIIDLVARHRGKDLSARGTGRLRVVK